MVNSERKHTAMLHIQTHMNTLLKLDFSPISPLFHCIYNSQKTTIANFWNDLDYKIAANKFLWRIWNRWNNICIMHFSMNLISLTIWNIDVQPDFVTKCIVKSSSSEQIKWMLLLIWVSCFMCVCECVCLCVSCTFPL